MKFHIGAILSVLTGKMLARDFGEVHALLDFMCDDNLLTHQIPRALDECKPHINRQLPFLDDEFVGYIRVGESIEGCLTRKTELFGEYHEVEKIPFLDHERIDPISELMSMVKS